MHPTTRAWAAGVASTALLVIGVVGVVGVAVHHSRRAPTASPPPGSAAPTTAAPTTAAPTTVGPTTASTATTTRPSGLAAGGSGHVASTPQPLADTGRRPGADAGVALGLLGAGALVLRRRSEPGQPARLPASAGSPIGLAHSDD
ncbi:MAG TPA: hypothetical protein VF954_06805 [Acidimicrobiales bacterium]